MIPLFKIFSLVIRVFCRPLVNYSKRYHTKNEAIYLRYFFIRLGNFSHRLQISINRRFLKIESQFAHKPLNDEIAIQKGIQFFYECIIYITLISLPTYQYYCSSRDSKKSKEQLDQKLSKIEEKSLKIENKLNQLIKFEEEKKKIQQQNKLLKTYSSSLKKTWIQESKKWFQLLQKIKNDKICIESIY